MISAERLVLPAEVEIVPVAALPAETRAQFAHGATDFLLSRPRARDVSRVIDTAAAALLARFRVPTRVADAVLDYSHEAGADPERVLIDAWPLLTHLVDDQLLIPERDAGAGTSATPLRPGSRIDRWTIVRAVRLLEDTEVYQVKDDTGRWFALKLVRRPGSRSVDPSKRTLTELDHEAAILEHLAGAVGPVIHARGVNDDGPFLVLDWCAGTDIETVADEIRALPTRGMRDALLQLSCDLVGAYTRLHALGVIHGDVHPRNVLVDRRGQVTLLDFAIARRLRADDTAVPRAGVAFYFEPELARAIVAGQDSPPATEAGEQFAVAALVYLLLTGAHYRDFPLEQQTFLRSVIRESPLPFADRHAKAWPDAERTLARALSKDPADRYPSMADFEAALRTVIVPVEAPVLAPRPLVDDGMQMLLSGVLARAAQDARNTTDEPPCSRAPRASVMHGAAGLAYALYRIALVRGSAELLSLADLWASRARAMVGARDAFEDHERGLSPLVYGNATPFHTVSGVHCVSALVASAVNDGPSLHESVREFIASSAVTMPANPDLMLGHAGVVLAAALLLDTIPAEYAGARDPLLDHGQSIVDVLWRTLDAYPAIDVCPRFNAAGAAHGWAGALYATLRWNAVSGSASPESTRTRLDELASHAEPWGRGVRWPHSLAPHSPERHTYLFGWCNGSAGHVHLWSLAEQLTSADRFAQLADGAAWSTWEQASDQAGDVCCGLAGAAYALLARYRATGDDAWLERAAALGRRAARLIAAEPPPRPDSLFHGPVGTALLVADLTRPERASMPFFGDDGWG